jgi:release factor glutamine methyltransferase
VEASAGIRRTDLVARDTVLSESTRAHLAELVARRVAGEPLQYVTGVAGFRRLELAVGPGVFIPRPETELVAERAMSRLPHGGTVVDVGTGSGAIALSIADERPDARVWATEVSDDARVWAEKNRGALGLDVEVVAGDLLSGLPGALRGSVDVVVANPPYVPEREREFLPTDVVGHEPAVALFGSDDGLAVVRRLADVAFDWLRPGGRLVLEIGHEQGAEVEAILGAAGYVDAHTYPDLAGRDRIVDAQRA